MRVEPHTAASAFIEEEFADALAALLAGSAPRDKVTCTSDLDLVVISDRSEAPHRETFEAYGNPPADRMAFVLVALIPVLTDLMCDIQAQWRGDGKWIPRAIEAFSPELAWQLRIAVAASLRRGDNRQLIELADQTLEVVGGRLCKGYSAGERARLPIGVR